jgi:Reverse transcriptase (RNA-dependent DNA polymerase)
MWKEIVPTQQNKPDELSPTGDPTDYVRSLISGEKSIFDKPNTLKDVKKSLDWPQWEKAIQSELQMLQEKGTWRLESLPADWQAIGNRWTFKKKFDVDGNLLRFKAQLVAQGFTQIPSQDFDQTFSPVMCMDSLCNIIAIAAILDLEMGQTDIRGAYLNGDLHKSIYMWQPEGYEDGTNRVA